MPPQDLQSAFASLEKAGRAVRVKTPIHWEFEAAAVLWELSHGPAVLFEDVVGYDIPLIGNLLNTRDKLATALGIDDDQLHERVLSAIDNRATPEVVDRAMCQEHVQTSGIDLLARFPLPLISERDGGRYISAGLVVARDPETGRQNLAICRLQYQGPDALGIAMAPTHSSQFLASNRRRNQKMQVAVVIGCHPGVVAASQLLVPFDEMEAAGGILGEPLRVARGRTVDLVVPSEAEIVLEGWIDPDETHEEGPFGEFPGTYAPERPNPVLHLTAVTTRTDPWFQMIVGGRHPEHLVTGAIAREAGLLRAVRAVVPGTRQVVLTEGGNCRFHAVIAIDQRNRGEAKLAMTAAFANQDLIKYVVVVDDDIDPTDPVEVEWAIATRMRPQDDLVMIAGMKSNHVDPMAIDRTITKLGIDATLPFDGIVAPTRSLRPDVPAAVREGVRSRWHELFPVSS
jgi:2,5-furandicarboxylate decarboxylase 1